MSVQGNTGPKWKGKIEKGFFRGRDSRQERLDLAVMGRKNPELFDVGLTNFFFFEHDEEKYGPKNQHISFFDFFKVIFSRYFSLSIFNIRVSILEIKKN